MNLESAAHAIGKDGFNWWIGQVENDGSDPENNGEESLDYDYTGKVKVRIVGFTTQTKRYYQPEIYLGHLVSCQLSMP